MTEIKAQVATRRKGIPLLISELSAGRSSVPVRGKIMSGDGPQHPLSADVMETDTIKLSLHCQQHGGLQTSRGMLCHLADYFLYKRPVLLTIRGWP